MKWTRAVHHLEELAGKCAEMATVPATIHPLRVVGLWAIGDLLGEQRDLEWVPVALVVDLPAEDVPWLSEPPGAQHWANATRLSRNPFTPYWRSVHVPVWNHEIDRPALVWDVNGGIAGETLAALREGRGADVREAAPTPADLRDRIEDEIVVSLGALRAATATYADRRWRPGRLEPVADVLWRASTGYFDLLDALGDGRP